jgi:hypothetical protein
VRHLDTTIGEVLVYVVGGELGSHTRQMLDGFYGVGFPVGVRVVVDLLNGFVAGFNGCGYVK